MTKKQIRKAYQDLPYLDKIERLELLAEYYLGLIGLSESDLKEALMEDVIVHYQEIKEDMQDDE